MFKKIADETTRPGNDTCCYYLMRVNTGKNQTAFLRANFPTQELSEPSISKLPERSAQAWLLIG